MKKLLRVTLAAAGICIVAGSGLSLAGYAMGGEPGFWIGRNGLYTNREAKELNSEKLVVLEKTELEPFTAMDIRVKYGDITVKPSGDESSYLEYRLYTRKEEPVYSVENGVLTVTCVPEPTDSEMWGSVGVMVIDTSYNHEKGSLTVYVPKTAFMNAAAIYSSDGSVVYDGPEAKRLDITSKYGSVKLKDAKAETVTLTASDGEIRCADGVFTTLDITNKYGETDLERIELDRLDIDASDSRIFLKDIVSKNVTVRNRYGSVKGSSVTADSLTVKQSDGLCDIRTADIKKGYFENKYGDIMLELTGAEKDYNYDLTMKYGVIKLNDRRREEKNLRENNGADKDIVVTANDGETQIITD